MILVDEIPSELRYPSDARRPPRPSATSAAENELKGGSPLLELECSPDFESDSDSALAYDGGSCTVLLGVGG